MFDENYREAIKRVLVFIEKHIDEIITLERLSKVARISRFHFHRIFSGYMGVSLGQYVKTKRLERSLIPLAHTDMKMIDVALSHGYESPAAFNKAFKKEFGMNPTQFKKKVRDNKEIKMTILKEKVPEFLGFNKCVDLNIYYIRKTGSYFESPAKAWKELLSILTKMGLKNDRHQYFGISHDNPHDQDVAEEDLRFDACVEATEELAKHEKEFMTLKKGILAGGDYAVFLHKGAYETLGDSFHHIYGHWLYANNYKVRNTPPFVRYRNLLAFETIDPKELETEIFIPVKEN